MSPGSDKRIENSSRQAQCSCVCQRDGTSDIFDSLKELG